MVFIIVAVQKTLNDLKSALKSLGYEVVDVESYNYPIDAIVYEGNTFQISHVSRNNMPDLSMSDRRANYGVLMINSLGKSVEEIDDMLKRRYYSPLF